MQTAEGTTTETPRSFIVCAYCGEVGHTMGKCVARMSDEAEARALAEQAIP
jgi:hypothetical protein